MTILEYYNSSLCFFNKIF